MKTFRLFQILSLKKAMRSGEFDFKGKSLRVVDRLLFLDSLAISNPCILLERELTSMSEREICSEEVLLLEGRSSGDKATKASFLFPGEEEPA